MVAALVLLNAQAAGGRAGRLRAPLQQWLQQQAPQVVLSVPATVADAQAQIGALSASQRVVVVGGDGSVNPVLGALVAGGHTLGVVPFGSGNDSARALGLVRGHWQGSLQHALHAAARPVDLGWAEFVDADGATAQRGLHFLSSFTVGFDSAVGRRALLGPRWIRGLPRYLLATLRELADLHNWNLEVRADGQAVYSGPSLLASSLNTPSFGGGMPAAPAALMDDGQLDLVLAGQFGRAATSAMLPRLLVGRHLGHPRVWTRRFAELSIQSQQAVPLAVDGEYLGQGRDIRVRVIPKALGVVPGLGAWASQSRSTMAA